MATPFLQLVKAKTAFAAIPSDEVPLFLEDHTLLGSCKEGLVVTDKALYVNYRGVKGRLSLNCITGIEVTYDSGFKMYHLNLCTTSQRADGSPLKIVADYCSGESDMNTLASFWHELLNLK